MKGAFAASLVLAAAQGADIEFGRYPGYEGPLSIQGHGGAYLNGNTAWVWYEIAGLEGECTSSGANGCGIHIHSGTTCDDADAVGGHYYDSDSIESDPWSPIVYASDGDGTAKGKTSVDIGDGQDISGRALVVHDSTGARVACGLLPSTLFVRSFKDVQFGPYPGYEGALKVTGEGGAYLKGDTAWVWYQIAGLEGECTSSGANGCGIHIHAGTTCDDADSVGGHYYDSDSIESDPWSSIVYASDGDGLAKGKSSVTIGDGQDISGRALVVHDSAGARVACALLPSSFFHV